MQESDDGRGHIHRTAGTKCSESTKGGCEEWQVQKAGRREGDVNESIEVCHANPPEYEKLVFSSNIHPGTAEGMLQYSTKNCGKG